MGGPARCQIGSIGDRAPVPEPGVDLGTGGLGYVRTNVKHLHCVTRQTGDDQAAMRIRKQNFKFNQNINDIQIHYQGKKTKETTILA